MSYGCEFLLGLVGDLLVGIDGCFVDDGVEVAGVGAEVFEGS